MAISHRSCPLGQVRTLDGHNWRTRTARLSQWLSHSLDLPQEGRPEPSYVAIPGAREHEGEPREGLPQGQDEAFRKLVREACQPRSARVREFQEAYTSLDAAGRCQLLETLVDEMGVDWARAGVYMRAASQHLDGSDETDAADSNEAQPGTSSMPTHDGCKRAGAAHGATAHGGGVRARRDLVQLERELSSALAPRYRRLVREINARPGGTKFLVDMRSDVLAAIRVSNTPTLRPLADLLGDHLATLLSPAFLILRRVTWQDPAAFLEKIVAHEAVHPFANLQDLKQRLGVGRRLFAYQHASLPGEPLVFIQVALTGGIPCRIHELLRAPMHPRRDWCREQDATTAVFYSITSAQSGLRGIELGHFLIKRVVEQLRAELPNIQTFVTLSPIPGFLHWLLPKLHTEGWSAAAVAHDSLGSAISSRSNSDISNMTNISNGSSGSIDPGLAPMARRLDPVPAGGSQAAQQHEHEPSRDKRQGLADASSGRAGTSPLSGNPGAGKGEPLFASGISAASNDSRVGAQGPQGAWMTYGSGGEGGGREGGGGGGGVDVRQPYERPLLSAEEQASILAAIASSACKQEWTGGDASTPPHHLREAYHRLHAVLARADWHTNASTAACLEPILMRLCCRYLIAEKKRGRALDPVANFHLSGGAELAQVNWMADTSAGALAQSAGIMVNYRYDLLKIESNSCSYLSGNRVSAASNLLATASGL
eukprot:jgi/Mesvir1/1864/Mv10499-RA.2